MASLSRPLLCSLLIHCAFFLCAVNLVVPKKDTPLVVDLTLSPPSGGSRGDEDVAAKEERGPAAPVERRGPVAAAPPRQQVAPASANRAAAPASEQPPAPAPRPAPIAPAPPAVTGQTQPARATGAPAGKHAPAGNMSTSGSGGKAENAGQGSGVGPAGNAGGTSGSPGNGGGHGSAAGASAEALQKKYLSEHFAYIQKIIRDHILYPQKARREGLQGKAFVSFVVLENGQVENVRLLQSTGHEILDLNLIKTIREAAPFPKPPIRAELRMPFTYRLER